MGALVQPPVTLVRADTSSYCLQLEQSSYCLQLEQGAALQHLAGPGGTPLPGAC